jgi:hypothetical protein
VIPSKKWIPTSFLVSCNKTRGSRTGSKGRWSTDAGLIRGRGERRRAAEAVLRQLHVDISRDVFPPTPSSITHTRTVHGMRYPSKLRTPVRESGAPRREMESLTSFYLILQYLLKISDSPKYLHKSICFVLLSFRRNWLLEKNLNPSVWRRVKLSAHASSLMCFAT